MEYIKIQINHSESITLATLSTILYTEIGEEYDISLEQIEGYFDFEYCSVLPDSTFITVVNISLPVLPTRDVNMGEIILSYLNSLESLENIIFITKVNDTAFQRVSTKYYEEIIDLEMDMRNILTYIVTYDKRRINKELFESFGIQVSEDLEAEKIKKNYENGLFYILFKDYKSFLDIKPLGNADITKLLQDPQINNFDDFKEKLRTKISEERHLDFLASVEAKFKQLDNIRNSVMHIHSLSGGEKRNYARIMQDTPTDKSLKTIIKDFWDIEKEILNKDTFYALSEAYIQNLFNNATYQSDTLLIAEDFQNDIIEELYSDMDDLQTAIVGYLTDDINIINYAITDDDDGYFYGVIEGYWDEKVAQS